MAAIFAVEFPAPIQLRGDGVLDMPDNVGTLASEYLITFGSIMVPTLRHPQRVQKGIAQSRGAHPTNEGLLRAT